MWRFHSPEDQPTFKIDTCNLVVLRVHRITDVMHVIDFLIIHCMKSIIYFCSDFWPDLQKKLISIFSTHNRRYTKHIICVTHIQKEPGSHPGKGLYHDKCFPSFSSITVDEMIRILSYNWYINAETSSLIYLNAWMASYFCIAFIIK
jgi:hypothetical protein